MYVRFGMMIATSMVVMFGLMYLNTYEFSHVEFSETRFYMTFIMGAAMAVIMLSFMQGMYKNTRVNIVIYAGSVIVFLIALFLVRLIGTRADRTLRQANPAGTGRPDATYRLRGIVRDRRQMIVEAVERED